MNIIICGAGKVGFSISKQLSAQGHSVTVIDQSSEDIKKINDTQDVKGIVGRATLPTVLENAGAEKADMVIAVTRNDETNMIVCQLASSLFNVSKKIARIRTKDFLEGKWGKLYNKSNIPIDVIISPEIEVARSLYRRLEAPGALDNVPFGNNKVKMLEISIEKTALLISELMNNSIEIVSEEKRKRPLNSEVNRLFGSNKKIFSLTDWNLEYGGIEGFKLSLIHI